MGVLDDKKAELAAINAEIEKAQKAESYEVGGNIRIRRRLDLLYKQKRVLENQIAALTRGSTRLATYINR